MQQRPLGIFHRNHGSVLEIIKQLLFVCLFVTKTMLHYTWMPQLGIPTIHTRGFWSVIHISLYWLAAPSINGKAEFTNFPFSPKRRSKIQEFTHLHQGNQNPGVGVFKTGCSWGNFQKSILGHNFGLECPTDLRSTPLSCIFNALYRDTPLGHIHRTQSNSQIAKYPNI